MSLIGLGFRRLLPGFRAFHGCDLLSAYEPRSSCSRCEITSLKWLSVQWAPIDAYELWFMRSCSCAA